jgi:membrane protein YdbS with pleckstrin-like domain
MIPRVTLGDPLITFPRAMRPPPARTLSDKAVAAWRVAGVRTTLLQGLMVVAFLAFTLRDALLVVAVAGAEMVAMASVLVLVAPRFRARIWRYEVDEHELYLQHGWLSITRHVVPLVRVQNVDTVQGPIDKLFGLSSVTLSTAGGKASIPHLDEPVAEELRARIADRVRRARGVGHEAPNDVGAST